MSITGAMQASISGLQAQSFWMSNISNNIANMNTVAYKKTSTQFSSAMTDAIGTNGFSAGGVEAVNVPLVDKQGLLQSTSSATDLAINGEGMFVVTGDPSLTSGTFFTRAGTFAVNQNGYLVNANGFFLLGERLDQTQRDAILGGDSQQMTATALGALGALEAIRVNVLTGSALPTSLVQIDANMPAASAIGDVHTVVITLYDQIGGQYSIDIEFEKTAAGAWDMNPAAGGLRDVDGNVLANVSTLNIGALTFNADGSLGTSGPFELDIAGALPNGSEFASPITLDLGTAGDVDGITQFNSSFAVSLNNQNGLAYGSFYQAEVLPDGVVNAMFTNGQRVPIYIIPLAQFTNLNGLEAQTGNVYLNSTEAGFQGLGQPKYSSAGNLSARALEQSTVDLAEEFTNMIVAQRAYSAAGKIISTADEMLDELVRLKR